MIDPKPGCLQVFRQTIPQHVLNSNGKRQCTTPILPIANPYPVAYATPSPNRIRHIPEHDNSQLKRNMERCWPGKRCLNPDMALHRKNNAQGAV